MMTVADSDLFSLSLIRRPRRTGSENLMTIPIVLPLNRVRLTRPIHNRFPDLEAPKVNGPLTRCV